MYSQIIGTQQIVVTAVFLAVMIVVLIILRRKGGAIRASLKAGKRISVVEDTAVSPNRTFAAYQHRSQRICDAVSKRPAAGFDATYISQTSANIGRNASGVNWAC